MQTFTVILIFNTPKWGGSNSRVVSVLEVRRRRASVQITAEIFAISDCIVG